MVVKVHGAECVCRVYPAFRQRAGSTAVAAATEKLLFLPFLSHFGSDCTKLTLGSLGFLYLALKLLFPMTWGIEILRDVVLNKVTLVELARIGVLPGLVLQTAVMLVGGLFIFERALKQARRSGELGSY
jgi:hypothetical protein